MLDDITKSIKATLYERATSPLFGSFALSWIAWNYQLLFTLFGEGDYDTKFSYIELFLYPDWKCYLLENGFVYPFTTAVIIILVYPWPALGLFWYWRLMQVLQKKVQQRVEDEEPMTAKEAAELRKDYILMQTNLEKELDEYRFHNRTLKDTIVDQAKELEAAHSKPDTIDGGNFDDEKTEPKPMFEGSAKGEGITMIASGMVSDNEESVKSSLTREESEILKYFDGLDDIMKDELTKTALTRLKISRNAALYYIGNLIKRKLLSEFHAAEGGRLTITHEGRKELLNMETKMTKEKRKKK